MAIQITNALLGPRPRMTFLSGNTALKSTQSQPVHCDADFDHPQIPFALVVNVPLVTMKPENGSTEIWLGTHINSGLHVQEGQHGDRVSGKILPDKLEERRKISPPMQPVIPKGSIIIRDLRLWHCGKPNLEGTTRVMLAMIHFSPWYRNPMRFNCISRGD
jgi:ectoine hydroxylase-related dioxygenase (phytanoyl-CoA dioxygenase family)